MDLNLDGFSPEIRQLLSTASRIGREASTVCILLFVHLVGIDIR